MNPHSVLDPVGPQAARVATLWWFSFAVAAVVYALTIGALLWAAWRAWRRTRRGEALAPNSEHRMSRSIAWSTGMTVAILLVFLVYDLTVGRAMTTAPVKRPLTVEVTGHQWWWEVQYADTSPHGRFTTANEVHVPVGMPVVLLLTARDVIHSFWVPNLGGKKDLIPGYTQSVWFEADTPGVYRGQCAEFCGLQHAKMGLLVIADPPDRYRAWARQMQQSAAAPMDSVTQRGQAVFMNGTCVMCHAIEGTRARSVAGPDLTHLASRQTIAAGTLANTRGALAGWIVDPQRIKPGTHMPPNALAPQDLDALLTYLQTLR